MALLIESIFNTATSLNPWTVTYSNAPGPYLTVVNGYLSVGNNSVPVGNISADSVTLKHSTLLTFNPNRKYLIQAKFASLLPNPTTKGRVTLGFFQYAADGITALGPGTADPVTEDMLWAPYGFFGSPGLNPYVSFAGNYSEANYYYEPGTFTIVTGFCGGVSIDAVGSDFFYSAGTPEVPGKFNQATTFLRLGITVNANSDGFLDNEPLRSQCAIEWIRVYDDTPGNSASDNLETTEAYGIITKNARNEVQVLPGKDALSETVITSTDYGIEVFDENSQLLFNTNTRVAGLVPGVSLKVRARDVFLGPYSQFVLYRIGQDIGAYSGTKKVWITRNSGIYPLGSTVVEPLTFDPVIDLSHNLGTRFQVPTGIVAESTNNYPGTSFPNMLYRFCGFSIYVVGNQLTDSPTELTQWAYNGTNFQEANAYLSFASFPDRMLFDSSNPQGRNCNNAPYLLKYYGKNVTQPPVSLVGGQPLTGFNGLFDTYGIETYDATGRINYSSRIGYLRRVSMAPSTFNFALMDTAERQDGFLVTLPNTSTVKYLLLDRLDRYLGIHPVSNNSFRYTFLPSTSGFSGTFSHTFHIYEEA